jgi:nickel-dependent lactate racemase
MTSQPFTVPFGRDELTFSAPAGWTIDTARARDSLPPADPRPAHDMTDAIAAAERVVIAFTDATRESPDQFLAEGVLARLQAAGFPLDRVSFLCAIGMHRPSTHAEKVAKLGADIVGRFPIIDHDPAGVVTIDTIDGVPVQVNPVLVEPGTLVVALGVVEPHQYAGYSGGAKTVVIGCGGPDTIGATHGPRFLNEPGTRLGNIEGNPFQAFVRQAGARIGLQWVENVVLDSQYQVVDHMSGPPAVVHDTLVARARQLYEVPVAAPYDVVIAGVGAPKDANLYQASRGPTYIGLSGRPVIRSGGVLILPAPIPEGAGQGRGEQNFIEVLSRYADLDAMMTDMNAQGCRPGEQRAYMVAQLLAQYHLIVVGAQDEAVVRAAHFTPVPTMVAAFEQAAALLGGGSIRALLVPHALQTIPAPR